MDSLYQRGVPPRARVLEFGCGWGLVGIACAKTFHAQCNGVYLATRHGTFADLTPQDLAARIKWSIM